MQMKLSGLARCNGLRDCEKGHELHLATLSYPDGHLGPIVGACGHILHLPQCQQAIDHFTKHDMFAIQEGARLSRDEKLAPIRSRPRIGHT